MRYSSYKAVEYDLKLHYKLLDKYTGKLNDLSDYRGYVLKQSKARGSRRYFTAKGPGMSGFNYIGGEGSEQLQHIRECAFYEKAVDVLWSNIAIMEEFLRIYKSTGAEHINELLGACYILPQDSLLLRDDVEADDWLRRMTEIKRKGKVFDPGGLTVTAFDGTPMRSRAEAFHYEAFYIYNIPVVFELPYEIDGESYWPDFTFYDVFTLTAKMLEHLGNWFHTKIYTQTQYRQDAVHKIDEYAKIGFYPGTNLFLTFGGPDNRFDVQAIWRQISMFASPPPSMETIEMLRRL